MLSKSGWLSYASGSGEVKPVNGQISDTGLSFISTIFNQGVHYTVCHTLFMAVINITG
jgi:hypothetical protein